MNPNNQYEKQLFHCHLLAGLIFIIFRRTEHIMVASKAKCCRESFGEVVFYTEPQMPPAMNM